MTAGATSGRPGCPSCVDGWTGYTPTDGKPVPCLRCRPHIDAYRTRWAQRDHREEAPEERLDRLMGARRRWDWSADT